MPNRHHQASNNYAQTQTSTHFQRHTHTHTHCTPNYPPDTAHKCLYARPSLFRSLQTYICGPCSGLCSLSRRLVTIRSLCCLSSRSHERPRTTEVSGRGRSPLILYIYIYTYIYGPGRRPATPPPIVSPPQTPIPRNHPHTYSYILYIHTLHYITLHCIALHYITLHTYMPIPTNLRRYIHTTPNPPHRGGGGEACMYLVW